MSEEKENKENENNGEKEILGIQGFLLMPENSDIAVMLFNEIEKLVYHKIDIGISIQDKNIYELGRYIGRLQILVNIAKDILLSSEDNETTKEMGEVLLNAINNIAVIYYLLTRNIDLNRFDNIFNTFKENVDNLNTIVLEHISI